MKLIFDTETTGFPQGMKLGTFPSPVEYQNYDTSRLIEFGYALIDQNLEIISKDSYLIQIDVEIPNSNIHGITNDDVKNGISLPDFLDILEKLLSSVESLIGHNLIFDINVLAAECYRSDRNELGSLLLNFVTCSKIEDTMRLGMKLIQSQLNVFVKNINSIKFPKLSELYQYLFRKKIIQSHRALGDVEICYLCYCQLIQAEY